MARIEDAIDAIAFAGSRFVAEFGGECVAYRGPCAIGAGNGTDVRREHGRATRSYHPVLDWNGRMNAIRARVLRAKLPRLAEDRRVDLVVDSPKPCIRELWPARILVEGSDVPIRGLHRPAGRMVARFIT